MDSTKTSTSIFTLSYWKSAAKEFKSVRILVLTALLIALRVAVKALQIPIIPGFVNFGFGFLVNALGAMTFGPVVAIVAAFISDLLGTLVTPQLGAYFFPYAFVEIAGSLIFALMFYKQKLTVSRIFLARFLVILICNLLMTPFIDKLYRVFILGKDFSLLNMITTVKIFKNLTLFPLESLLLALFLKYIIPLVRSIGFKEIKEPTGIKFTVKNVVLLILLSLIALAGALVFFELNSKEPLFEFMGFV